MKKHPFAPGVITRGRRSEKDGILASVLRNFIASVVLVGLAFLIAGCL